MFVEKDYLNRLIEGYQMEIKLLERTKRRDSIAMGHLKMCQSMVHELRQQRQGIRECRCCATHR